MNVLYLLSEIRYTAGWPEPERRIDRLFSSRDRIDIHPSPSPVEAHISIHQRKNGVIAAESHVSSGQKFRPALADNDVASHDQLAAKFFYAQPLADAVTPVFDAALSFFMSHFGSR
jgi:hypothetical protein